MIGDSPTPVTGDDARATAEALAPAPPTPAAALPFPSPTAAAVVSFASATAVPLALARIEPSSAVAGSGAALTVHGAGFDALATVTIGASDITHVTLVDGGFLRFALPASLAPGVYTVAIAEPDGRRGTLPRSLTVLPRLLLRADLLHPAVARGAIAVVLAQSTSGAQLDVRVADARGRSLAGIATTLQRGPRGEWRALLAVGAHAPIGPARVLVLAQWRGQRAQVALPLRVVAVSTGA
jgi:hypothetical protein